MLFSCEPFKVCLDICKMFKIYFVSPREFRFVLTYILAECIDCHILTEIKNFSNHFGIGFDSDGMIMSEHAEMIVTICKKSDILFDFEWFAHMLFYNNRLFVNQNGGKYCNTGYHSIFDDITSAARQRHSYLCCDVDLLSTVDEHVQTMDFRFAAIISSIYRYIYVYAL